MQLYSIITFLLLAMTIAPCLAQQLFRGEAVPYLMREDATNDTPSTQIDRRSKQDNIIPFAVGEITENGAGTLFVPPADWSAGRTILHLENIGKSYTLEVNNEVVAVVTDPLSPAQFDITRLLTLPHNSVAVLTPNTDDPLSQGVAPEQRVARERFSECYFYNIPECHIVDFKANIHPDKSALFAHLDIYIELKNMRNYTETVDLGFDIYDPSGKLLDYSYREVEVQGQSTNIAHFHSYIYDAEPLRWSTKNPNLYTLTILTRKSGLVTSYTPRKVAYLGREYRNGELYNFGEKQELIATPYNARYSIEATIKVIKELKTKGFNTLQVSYPQSKWFYDICDQEGMYVIEQANINAPQQRDNRAIGGTPSNDPQLLSEYLRRTKHSYQRVKSHPSVIAFSLGSDSGNGYNMYKSYQQLKELEGETIESRPIIYSGAKGEWNSDKLNLR